MAELHNGIDRAMSLLDRAHATAEELLQAHDRLGEANKELLELADKAVGLADNIRRYGNWMMLALSLTSLGLGLQLGRVLTPYSLGFSLAGVICCLRALRVGREPNALWSANREMLRNSLLVIAVTVVLSVIVTFWR